MKHTHLITATAVLAALACNGVTDPAPRHISSWGPDPAPGLELSGRIAVSRNGQDLTVSLTTPDGELVALIGTQVQYLASVNDAMVKLVGAWEEKVVSGDTTSSDGPDRSVSTDDVQAQAATPNGKRFIVYSFEVTAVLDRPALDGILELTIDGYAIRTANGEVRLVTGCPESIAEHVGKRLWVVGSEDQPPVEFGLIDPIR